MICVIHLGPIDDPTSWRRMKTGHIDLILGTREYSHKLHITNSIDLINRGHTFSYTSIMEWNEADESLNKGRLETTIKE